MPGLDTTTTGNDAGSGSGQQDTDIGSGGTTTVGGGNTVVSSGSGAGSTYQFEIISMHGGAGNAYLASNNSTISCNSSVALMNRNNAFSCISQSSGNFSNCCNYVAQIGFNAQGTSRLSTYMCCSSLSTYNYNARASSSLSASVSTSVFPIEVGTRASQTSSISLFEFESMTSFWATNNNGAPIPTHFVSEKNSFIENSSRELTTKTITPINGLSGPVLNGKPISFMWSQIWVDPITGLSISNSPPPSSLFSSPQAASYRYVPFTHSLDYSNIVSAAGDGTILNSSVSADTTRGLISLLAFGRNCYTSVKPPAYMFPPEDRSGVVGIGGLTGTYTLSNLLGAL